MIAARKLSFQEVWDTLTVFFVDKDLEQDMDQEIERLLRQAQQYGAENLSSPEVLATLLQRDEGALGFVLREIDLSEEKFLRIISLLRKIGTIAGGLDKEWTMNQIARRIRQDREFALLIARLFLEGARDPALASVIPRYYLETLNFGGIASIPDTVRRARYKHSLIGTYSGRKGYKVEGLVQRKLESIQCYYGVGYQKGRSRFVETDIDFAIPTLDDPWVIIMCSFQETTSSGQPTKARDMLEAYDRIRHSNTRHKENRVFVNFVDGGGWLARRRDLERLVENCHYILNLHYLDMLESIVRKHVPNKYFNPPLLSASP